MTTLHHDLDADGILTLTIDLPGQSMNVINADFTTDLAAAIETIKSDASDQGRRRHQRQGVGLHGRGRPQGDGRARRRRRLGRGRRGQVEDGGAVRQRLPPQQAVPRPRNVRQAGRRGDQRAGTRRRARAGARVPLPRVQRQSEDRARPARGPRRPVPRRRRHAAPAAPDGRPAGADVPDAGQEHVAAGGARLQGGERTRPRRRGRRPRQGVGAGQPEGGRAVGREGVQVPRRRRRDEPRLRPDLHGRHGDDGEGDQSQYERADRDAVGGLRGDRSCRSTPRCASNRSTWPRSSPIRRRAT